MIVNPVRFQNLRRSAAVAAKHSARRAKRTAISSFRRAFLFADIIDVANDSFRNPFLALWDRVFGENLLRSSERLVRCRLRRHSFGDDVVPGVLKDMLGIELGVGRAVRLIEGKGRPDAGFRDVGRAVLVARIEPKWVGLDQFRIGDRPAAEPTFQVFVKHLGLDRIFQEFFSDVDILGAFGDDQTKLGHLRRQRLTIIAERQTMSNLILV